MSPKLATDKKADTSISSKDDAASSQLDTPTSEDPKTQKVPWYAYIWDYEPNRTREERVFVSKLDAYLITILSLGYFIKNLDQTNISNAYVSGMKEDLAMYVVSSRVTAAMFQQLT
jgi:ACS family pantothenate transporter-like MFS transporter